MMPMSKYDQEFHISLPSTVQTEQLEEPAVVSDADYEQMYTLLYSYRFDTISFLELLDKIEAILHIDAI